VEADENLAKRAGVGGFEEQDFYAGGCSGESSFRLGKWYENGQLDAAALLRRFEKDFLPAVGALDGCGEEPFFAAGGGEWNDAGDAEFCGFFESPLEGVKFYDREKESGLESGDVGGESFEEGEVDAVARNGFDFAEPDGGAVAEFVELTRLGAKDASEVMSEVALERGVLIFEVVDEEAAAHVR